MNKDIYVSIPYDVYEEARIKIKNANTYVGEFIPLVSRGWVFALAKGPHSMEFVHDGTMNRLLFGNQYSTKSIGRIQSTVRVFSGESLNLFNEAKSCYRRIQELYRPEHRRLEFEPSTALRLNFNEVDEGGWMVIETVLEIAYVSTITETLPEIERTIKDGVVIGDVVVDRETANLVKDAHKLPDISTEKAKAKHEQREAEALECLQDREDDIRNGLEGLYKRKPIESDEKMRDYIDRAKQAIYKKTTPWYLRKYHKLIGHKV